MHFSFIRYLILFSCTTDWTSQKQELTFYRLEDYRSHSLFVRSLTDSLLLSGGGGDCLLLMLLPSVAGREVSVTKSRVTQTEVTMRLYSFLKFLLSKP